MKQIGSIKVYNGTGVERKSLPFLLQELSHWNVTLISAQEILNTSWETETSLLIIPGGRDIPYHGALQGEGNRRIKQYVANGGSFLGICAGAYYGCARVEFDCGMELEVIGSRELAFFPGIARGPVYGPGSFRYRSEYGAQAALISNGCGKEALRSYYNGGCYFVETERYPHVHVISNYLEVEECPAAIVEIPIGKGKAILSGVHIEMGTSYQPTHFKKEMLQKLASHELQRKCFFQEILNRLCV